MRSRKQRRLDREKLTGRIETMSKNIGRKFAAKITGKTCCRCDKPATGIGSGEFYCHDHFWMAFEEREQLTPHPAR